jgi:glycosylphosphatidylinositol deacylase
LVKLLPGVKSTLGLKLASQLILFPPPVSVWFQRPVSDKEVKRRPARMAEEDEPAAAEEEAAAPAPGAPDPKQDDVKPVVFIAAFIATLFALGGLDLLWGLEENGCKMTYMFEYPAYVPVPLEAEVAVRFPKYGLYAYGEGEGKPVERLKAGKFSGIPVLFIPGNSGSHKQVRSLASVALRMAIKQSEYKVHFDYFSVDLAEEHSAFYGGVLDGQVEFVSEAIAKILSLYPAKQGAPNSVVLIGHSLGGVIGKALFSLPGFPAAQVSLLVTLAAPHTPVLLLDSQTAAFYRRVDAYWAQHRPAALQHVTLASIGGGLRDLQVGAGLLVHVLVLVLILLLVLIFVLVLVLILGTLPV